jgi:hypothetical protein
MRKTEEKRKRVEIGRAMEGLGRRFHPVVRKNKIWCHFAGADISSSLFCRFDSQILFLFHKVLVHKISDSSWGFGYVEDMLYIHCPRG